MLFFKKQKAQMKGKPVKYYPQVVTVGKAADTQEVARRIARESTLSPADVHAVIRALPEVMSQIMSEGRSVSLDGLGSFRYTGVVGKTVDRAEDVSADLFTSIRVRFTPARERRDLGAGYTRALVGNISFTEWQGKTAKPNPDSGTSGTSPGGEGTPGGSTPGGEAPDPAG
ncbi:putative DNA-binding protein [Bacteroides pyogenes F0041]|uniref:Putative DNA-binding protein n=1 Tax=Bacteroides pyogenes F0041 TaxID=1321819 RepID=U2CX25_9BACE|nr:HU family DNA-binding protein [Bacteroides pyogenes]ERI88618.1 putative DNA-binding protein [Bacteroides pyogenes F0041]MBB3895731.1 putative histone-like DNA-binding protein [Bacteroides pyogenes]SUV33410.1 DNA-binding protein [Bacteroides pyogenes]